MSAAWAKPDDGTPRPFNTRGEMVATSPMFREPFKARRCLMPATAFFEWKGATGSKMRYKFSLPDGELFRLGG